MVLHVKRLLGLENEHSKPMRGGPHNKWSKMGIAPADNTIAEYQIRARRSRSQSCTWSAMRVFDGKVVERILPSVGHQALLLQAVHSDRWSERLRGGSKSETTKPRKLLGS
jgi:hypothetical protein